MNPLLKHTAEALLCLSGAPRLARVGRRGDTLVLAYHNVVPEGEPHDGDRSLHLAQRLFAQQLDLLQRTHDVVPLATFLEPAAPRTRPRAVITFDDAYQGALTAGVEELRSRGMPATIFVAPGLLEGRTFWWDELAPPGVIGLPDAVREVCLSHCRGVGAEVRGWAKKEGIPLRSLPAHQRGTSEADLTAALSGGAITLAAHTWSHPNLPRLRPEELEQELSRPLQWLRERFEGILPWLSYPYGLSSPAVAEATRRAGYEGAFRVDGGWLPRGPERREPFALPRANVPSGASLRRFELRTSGVVGR